MNKLELSSLYQLTLTRFLLIAREPEAIFWIFIFPILLAVGLGIAFRNRPPDVLPVGATTAQLAQALAADKGLKAEAMDEAAGDTRAGDGEHCAACCWAGRTAWCTGTTTPIPMRVRRGCWPIARSQIAAGQRDPLQAAEPDRARDRLALHRLCGAGAAGDEPDGLGDVGAGICHCGGAAEEAAEADGGLAHAAVAVSGGVSAVAAGHAGD